MTKATEADLASSEWVMTYKIAMLKATMERRPARTLPEADGVYFIDFGTALRPGPSRVGMYINSEWCGTNRKPLKDQPHHWTRYSDTPEGVVVSG